MTTSLKIGRPKAEQGKPSGEHRMVSFRVDEETFTAIRALEDAVADGVVSTKRRSIAIRKAVLEAYARLRANRP